MSNSEAVASFSAQSVEQATPPIAHSVTDHNAEPHPEAAPKKKLSKKEWVKLQRPLLTAIDDPKARFQQAAMTFVKSKREKFTNEGSTKYCENCWLIKKCCFCSQLKPVVTRHRYCNWLHYKEFARSTNTGTLLTLSGPNTRQFIHGDAEDDAALEKMMKEEGDHTVFLYPSPTSISIRDYYQSRRSPEEGPITDWDEFLRTAPVLNIIGVDSTWGQARTMSSGVLQTIPRVHLTDPPHLSISNMRNQTQSGRITTAEAFVCVMRELHETPESIDNLLFNLKLRTDTWQVLSGPRAKREPWHSVANREIAQKKNQAIRAEKRARREAAATKLNQQGTDASSSSMASSSSGESSSDEENVARSDL